MDPQAQDPAEKEEDAFMLTKLVEGYPELVRSSWSAVARAVSQIPKATKD